MATLITGHKGFVGLRLSRYIKHTGIDVKEGMNVLSCELPKGVNVIYHLAAQTSVEASWHDPVHDMDNLRMVARLVKEYPDAKIIYTNSAAAFEPQSPYGFSKRACAEYLKAFHKNYVICNLPNLYGEGSKSVVDIFKSREEVIIYGDGQQTRDYVHVDDIVEALLKAHDWPTGEYYLGSTVETSVLQLAEGKKVKFLPERKEAKHSVLPNTTPNWRYTHKVLEYLMN